LYCYTLSCVDLCCSKLPYVTVYCSVLQRGTKTHQRRNDAQVCCSMLLQYVAAVCCCSMLQYVILCCSVFCCMFSCVVLYCSVLQCVALQCVAVCCSVVPRRIKDASNIAADRFGVGGTAPPPPINKKINTHIRDTQPYTHTQSQTSGHANISTRHILNDWVMTLLTYTCMNVYLFILIYALVYLYACVDV